MSKLSETEMSKREFIRSEHVSALEHDLYDAVIRLETQLATALREWDEAREAQRLLQGQLDETIADRDTAVDALEWYAAFGDHLVPLDNPGKRARDALAAIRAPEQWPEFCTTCHEPYNDASPSVCSNAFHCCRDCTWRDGVVIRNCRKHAVIRALEYCGNCPFAKHVHWEEDGKLVAPGCDGFKVRAPETKEER